MGSRPGSYGPSSGSSKRSVGPLVKRTKHIYPFRLKRGRRQQWGHGGMALHCATCYVWYWTSTVGVQCRRRCRGIRHRNRLGAFVDEICCSSLGDVRKQIIKNLFEGDMLAVKIVVLLVGFCKSVLFVLCRLSLWITWSDKDSLSLHSSSVGNNLIQIIDLVCQTGVPCVKCHEEEHDSIRGLIISNHGLDFMRPVLCPMMDSKLYRSFWRPGGSPGVSRVLCTFMSTRGLNPVTGQKIFLLWHWDDICSYRCTKGLWFGD